MIRFYVIRHGETEPNTRFACIGRIDVPLNEKGTNQATELCDKLKAEADVIYVSPLLRARQTIEPYIKSHPDVPVIIQPNIIERDFGIWEDLSFKDIEKADPVLYDEWQRNYVEYRIPNGESLTDVQKRVDKFLGEILKQNDGKTVFLMTHLCTARHIIAGLLGLDVHKSRCFTLKNASYAVIDYDFDLGFGVLKTLNV